MMKSISDQSAIGSKIFVLAKSCRRQLATIERNGNRSIPDRTLLTCLDTKREVLSSPGTFKARLGSTYQKEQKTHNIKSNMDVRKLLRGKQKLKKAADPPAATNGRATTRTSSVPANQPIELGTINYSNLTKDGRHGDYEAALEAAQRSGKPLFVNFVEWSG